MDVCTRGIVGLAAATKGGAVLVAQALWSGLLIHARPRIFHSDNGVEYKARVFRDILATFGIALYRSKKGCTWERGTRSPSMTSSRLTWGIFNRFDSLGALVAVVYRTL